MADLKETSFSLLASASLNAQTLTKQTVYTVPAGKTMIPMFAIIRSVSASLVGLTDLDMGGDSGAGDWIQEIDLSHITTTTNFIPISHMLGSRPQPFYFPVYAEATVFGVKINVGSTGAATFVVDLFGYLF